MQLLLVVVEQVGLLQQLLVLVAVAEVAMPQVGHTHQLQ
jgi:hypothetical protein